MVIWTSVWKLGWISWKVLKHDISLVLRYLLCSYLSLFHLFHASLWRDIFYITGEHRVMTEHSTKIYWAKVLTDHPKKLRYLFSRWIFRNEFWNTKWEHNLASIVGISWNLAFCVQFAYAYTHKTFEIHVQFEKWFESEYHRNFLVGQEKQSTKLLNFGLKMSISFQLRKCIPTLNGFIHK